MNADKAESISFGYAGCYHSWSFGYLTADVVAFHCMKWSYL